MAKQHKGGLIAGFDQLRAPNAPTIGATTAGDEQVAVAFTAASDAGAGTVSSFAVTGIASGASTGASGTSSPVTVTGLTNGTEVTFSVIAISEFGASPSSGTVTGTAEAPPIGLFGGGSNTSGDLDKIIITTTGNATDFGGNMSDDSERQITTCVSSSTRALFAGGNSNPHKTTIDLFLFASAGNAVDFGDVFTGSTGNQYGSAPASNGTKGLFAGNGAGDSNEISIVTIATAGNGADFGNLTVGRFYAAGTSSTTRAIFGGGYADYNTIDFVIIASTGNATDFGDLTAGRMSLHNGVVSSSTRGLFAGGVSAGPTVREDIIEYITMGTEGNGTDFGNLAQDKTDGAACSSKLRGVFAGGTGYNPYTGKLNVIEYVTIATIGNAADFGDLTQTNYNQGSGGSSGHGGIA